MNDKQEVTTGARMLGPKDGVVMGAPGARSDRFMIDGKESGGGFALIEHTVPPHVLAGPLHRHAREDEYSFVLEGQLGALLGEEEVVAQAGDLVFKPRNQWHTFWNPGDVPTRILEIISPAGLEEFFRELGALEGKFDPATLPAFAARYGAEVDFERTSSIVERHRLKF